MTPIGVLSGYHRWLLDLSSSLPFIRSFNTRPSRQTGRSTCSEQTDEDSSEEESEYTRVGVVGLENRPLQQRHGINAAMFWLHVRIGI